MNEKKKWYQLDHRSTCNLIVVSCGILLYLCLTHLARVSEVVSSLVSVLSPFIAGFLVAYLLNTPTNYMEKKFDKFKNPRIPAIVTVYILAVVFITVLLDLIVPQVGASVSNLIENMSMYLDNLDGLIDQITETFDLKSPGLDAIWDDYQSIMKKVADVVAASVPNLLNFGVAVGNGLINACTAIIASIYMLAGKDQLVRQMKKLIYALFPTKAARKIVTVSAQANQTFVGFINGKLIDSLIIGILCFILTLILHIPYGILLSLIVGVTNVIPFFGPIIGAIPCLMILIIVDPSSALVFLILIIALQQFDGNILGPKILGNSTGLSAIWVLVAIVVGGGLFGFAGMILGVPTFAVFYSLMREWADQKLEQKGIDANGDPVGLAPLPVEEPTEENEPFGE